MSGTFQGVGTLQFTPDNKHVFAASGSISITSEKTLLEFETQSYYLKIQIAAVAFGVSNEDFKYRIKYNNTQIQEIYYIDTYKNYDDDARDFYYIIPPFTTLTITGESVGGTSGDLGAIVSGTVHGAIEQFSLEVKE